MKAFGSFRGLLAALLLLFLSSPSPLLGAEKKGEGTRPQYKPPKADMVEAGEDIPDWKARWELARLLSYVKRYQESLAEYEKVIREKPDLQEVRIEMGMVLYWSGQPDKAMEILTRVPLDRLDDQGKLIMAEIYTAQKEYQKAESIYRAFLEKNPDDMVARYKLAQLLSWTKRYDESLENYALILRARPDDIQVRRKYAFVLIWAGRHAEAIEELQKTLK